MPGMSGLDVAQQASGRCHVAFVTAYDNIAVAAFEQGAVDYVMKPFSPARLATTVARLKEQLAARRPISTASCAVGSPRRPRAPRSYLRWITASHGNDLS